MKATPYELVFGQPPRQNFFPGAKGKCIMEEDVEDLLDKEEELMSGCDGSGTSGADDCGPALDGSSDDEGLAGEAVSDHGNGTGGADDGGPALDGSSDDEGLAGETVSDRGNGTGGADDCGPALDGSSDDEGLAGETVSDRGNGTGGADDYGPALDGSSDDEGLAGETVSDRGNGTGGADDYGPALDGSSDDEGLAEEAVSDDGDGNGGALASTEKHKKLREEADKRYRANAEKMQLKYCKGKRKKVRVFCPGNFVSVRIPRIDRASTDSHRLPCVVVERLGKVHHLYRLR